MNSLLVHAGAFAWSRRLSPEGVWFLRRRARCIPPTYYPDGGGRVLKHPSGLRLSYRTCQAARKVSFALATLGARRRFCACFWLRG